MNDRSINSPPYDGGDAQRAEGVCGLIASMVHDPRFKALLLLPEWEEPIFVELMEGVDPDVYVEVYSLLRKMLFVKRNEMYNPFKTK